MADILCMHSKKMKKMKEVVTLTVGGNCGWRRKELKRGKWWVEKAAPYWDYGWRKAEETNHIIHNDHNGWWKEEEEKVRILGNEGKPRERCKLRIMVEKEEENLEMKDVSFVLLAHAFVARLHTIYGHN